MPKNQETFIYFTKLQMPLGLSRSCIQDFRLQNVSKDFDRNAVLVYFFLQKVQCQTIREAGGPNYL